MKIIPETGFSETSRNSDDRQIGIPIQFLPRFSDILALDRVFKRKKQKKTDENDEKDQDQFKRVEERIKKTQREKKKTEEEKIQGASPTETEPFRTETDQKIENAGKMIDQKRNRAGKIQAEKIDDAKNEEVNAKMRRQRTDHPARRIILSDENDQKIQAQSAQKKTGHSLYDLINHTHRNRIESP